jgi:hypothetical protein
MVAPQRWWRRVCFNLLDWQLGLLVDFQIWRDTFFGVSLAFACDRGEVISLEQGYWSRGGGSIILLRWSRWGGGSRSMTTWGRPLIDVPQRHKCRCVFINSQRLISDIVFLDLAMVGSSNGGGYTFLLACVSATLELSGGRCLWCLQLS